MLTGNVLIAIIAFINIEVKAVDKIIAALDVNSAEYHQQYAASINWLAEKLDPSKLKNELVKYARSIGREDDATNIPQNLIVTEGRIAYCLNRGAKLEDRSVKRVIDLLDQAASANVNAPATSDLIDDVPESAYSRSLAIYTTCYSLIDNTVLLAANGKLALKSIPDEVRNIVRKFADSKDKTVRSLERHYQGNLNDAHASEYVTSWIKPLSIVVDTLQLMLTNTRKPRKNSKAGNYDNKAKKAAAKVNFNTGDATLGLKSANPQAIIGSEIAVVFNTKNRHCELYIAETGGKLSISGSRITNFDTKKSVGKTLRNPEETLPHWTRAGNLRRFEVLAADVKGKAWELNGKLNRNSIIVKVV